jgi:hypothetical protein
VCQAQFFAAAAAAVTNKLGKISGAPGIFWNLLHCIYTRVPDTFNIPSNYAIITLASNYIQNIYIIKLTFNFGLLNIWDHFKWVPCHNRMARCQVAGGGDGLQIRRQLHTYWISSRWQPTGGGLSAWVLGRGVKTSQGKTRELLRNVHYSLVPGCVDRIKCQYKNRCPAPVNTAKVWGLAPSG